jgi:L-amino acid N-acyltransferase YncA
MNQQAQISRERSSFERQYRPARREDLLAMAVIGRSGAMFQHVLRQRYPSIDRLLSDIFEQQQAPIAYVSTDQDGYLVGWACCFAFHARAGYAGVVQLALGWSGSITNGAVTNLYELCERACIEQNVRSIIGFATAKTPELSAWYVANGFEHLGNLDLADADELRAYCKAVQR